MRLTNIAATGPIGTSHVAWATQVFRLARETRVIAGINAIGGLVSPGAATRRIPRTLDLRRKIRKPTRVIRASVRQNGLVATVAL